MLSLLSHTQRKGNFQLYLREPVSSILNFIQHIMCISKELSQGILIKYSPSTIRNKSLVFFFFQFQIYNYLFMYTAYKDVFFYLRFLSHSSEFLKISLNHSNLKLHIIAYNDENVIADS